MKVLHVTPSYFPAFVYGGPIRSTHQLNLALATLGVQIRVLTTDANGQGVLPESGRTVQYHDHLAAQYERRNLMPDISIGLLMKLPGLVRWADVVHLTAVYSFTTLPTLFWSRLFGKAVFWSPRGALQEWEGSPRRGLKAGWDAACKLTAGGNVTIVAASEREAEAARKRFPRFAVVCVENGVVVPSNVQRRESEAVPRLLFLGRVHPIKGIENLLDALADIRSPETAATLTIAGPGEAKYLRSLRAKVEKLGLGNTVDFAGPVDEAHKSELFARCDVLVLPSFSENFGLVVAEALAHGVPVVVSRHAPWSKVEEKGCGLWVENDRGSLAAALSRLLQADRPAMGARGRQWMQAEFAWREKATQLCEYYKKASRR